MEILLWCSDPVHDVSETANERRRNVSNALREYVRRTKKHQGYNLGVFRNIMQILFLEKLGLVAFCLLDVPNDFQVRGILYFR